MKTHLTMAISEHDCETLLALTSRLGNTSDCIALADVHNWVRKKCGMIGAMKTKPSTMFAFSSGIKWVIHCLVEPHAPSRSLHS